MKINIKNKDPYTAVVDVIRELTKENGYECMFDRIVRIRTTVLGESNEYLGVDNGDYYWQSDWYEGGEVELLGYIDVCDIDVPKLKDQEAEREIEGGCRSWWYVCGECHGAIDRADQYCRHCGRKIKE